MPGMSASAGRPVAALEEFFSGWRFPALLLFSLLFATLALLGVLLFPPGKGDFAAFAEEFRRWCFGVDPATGKEQWSLAAAFFFQPVLLAAVTIAVWRRPLREALAEPRRLWPWAGTALVLVVLLAAGFRAPREARPSDELAFPAEDLRTAHTPPAFSLTNQEGALVSLQQFRGRPVLVTAIYGSCSLACPLIVQQAKRVVAELTPEERAELAVVAITLDPERDTRETLAETARLYEVSLPLFHLLGGEPAVVNPLLDRFGFERTRNSETDAMDHANLFVLMDRAGRISYRFTLGERQERWLADALRLLLREERPGG